jgi:hypothetical protein
MLRIQAASIQFNYAQQMLDNRSYTFHPQALADDGLPNEAPVAVSALLSHAKLYEDDDDCPPDAHSPIILHHTHISPSPAYSYYMLPLALLATSSLLSSSLPTMFPAYLACGFGLTAWRCIRLARRDTDSLGSNPGRSPQLWS